MHRSRSALLVILAAAAACSTQDASEDTAILAQDSSLVARLEVRQTGTLQAPPAACSAAANAVQPAANKSQAEKLARQAYDAELLGQVQEARTLLLRASALDGTDRTAAYHLARTSEVLGDRATAVTAYCRFLALAPSATESAEVRQRLATLSPRETRAVARTVSRSAPVATAQRTTPRATPRRPVQRVARAEAEPPVRAASRARGASSTNGEQGGMDEQPTPSAPVITSTAADGSVDLPAPPSSRTASRGPSRIQGAGIGAVAGAMIGAATGRSVKSAVIGAAAGGLLGTVVVGQRMQR